MLDQNIKTRDFGGLACAGEVTDDKAPKNRFLVLREDKSNIDYQTASYHLDSNRKSTPQTLYLTASLHFVLSPLRLPLRPLS